MKENTMPQFRGAGYLPDDFDRSRMDEAVGREIHALNKEMIGADMDAAVACARKGVAATRGQVEVREIFFNPAPD
jgi:hypothetical protein